MYQIFENMDIAEANLIRVNQLLGYPKNMTTTYRKNILHPVVIPSDIRVVGAIDQELVDACSEMTHEERIQYYDNLVDMQYVLNEGWFPNPYQLELQ